MHSEFEAVEENLYISDWARKSQVLFPDDELGENDSLDTLRQISNKLVKNNFLVYSAQQTYCNCIIGGSVIPKVHSDNKRAESEVTRVLNDFCAGMDINRKINISQLSEMLVNSAFINGDILINLPMDESSDSNIKTYVELIEAHRIRTPPKHRANPLVREGVEYDSFGRLLGYHVVKYVKKNTYNTIYAADTDFTFVKAVTKVDGYKRVTAKLFEASTNIRPLQSRQCPVSTPIMTLLKYISQYLEAVLIGARVAACFAAFIKTANPVAAQKSLSEATTIGKSPSGGTNRRGNLSPGLISCLKPGEDIVFASPNKPSDNHDPFILRLVRFVASTYRIPYEMYLLDLSTTSYSSWRGGSIEVSKNMNRWRRDLINTLDWIFDTVLLEAVSSNLITTSIKNVNVSIRLPKMKSLDEEKTARADKIELTNKTNSIQRICDESDVDYDELLVELTQETKDAVNLEATRLLEQKEKSKEMGIIFPEDLKAEMDRVSAKRPGESGGENVSEEDAKERRKEDGNWKKS